MTFDFFLLWEKGQRTNSGTAALPAASRPHSTKCFSSKCFKFNITFCQVKLAAKDACTHQDYIQGHIDGKNAKKIT